MVGVVVVVVVQGWDIHHSNGDRGVKGMHWFRVWRLAAV